MIFSEEVVASVRDQAEATGLFGWKAVQDLCDSHEELRQQNKALLRRLADESIGSIASSSVFKFTVDSRATGSRICDRPG